MVIAIDPGPEISAVLVWDGRATYKNMVYCRENQWVLDWLKGPNHRWPLVIEKVASFGMPVGAEVFETVYWSGRFAEAYGADSTHRITRIEVKNYLCHSSRAKDGNIRQALIDRFGVVGTKKTPGPLYGISLHLWAALAVAVTWHDQNELRGELATRDEGIVAR